MRIVSAQFVSGALGGTSTTLWITTVSPVETAADDTNVSGCGGCFVASDK